MNNRRDPNGLVPSKEEMLSFGQSDMDWFYGSPGLCRGYTIGNESTVVRKACIA